jgi:hypothetical protein
VFWTHNDSGAGPDLYAISSTGSLLAHIRVQGAKAVDWEDLSFDQDGALWIGDFGNNKNKRRDLTLYRVPEPPLVRDGTVTVDKVVTFSFPEQTAFPMRGRKNFDVESLFFADGTAWVLTKHRSDLDTTLYRFPALDGHVELERISAYTLGGDPDNFGGMATAADVSPDGQHLAVLAYHAIFLFKRPDVGHDWLAQPVVEVALDQDVTQQCEGLSWDGDGLLLANEDLELHRIGNPFRLSGGRYPPGPAKLTPSKK